MVTLFNKRDWGHTLDLGQCARDCSFYLEARIECEVIFLGLDCHPTSPPYNLAGCLYEDRPGANVADQ